VEDMRKMTVLAAAGAALAIGIPAAVAPEI
jgi:hypothetical protein